MEITTHDLWTVVHGMGFGALFMLAFSGAIGELYHLSTAGANFLERFRRRIVNLFDVLSFNLTPVVTLKDV